MKNVKLFLSAIAIIGIVSGALAFRSARGSGNLFCTSTEGSGCSATADYQVVAPGALSLYCGSTQTACTNATTLTNGVLFKGEPGAQ